MKIMLPVRGAILLLLAVPVLAGCGSSKPTPISPSFVPAGYSRVNMPGLGGSLNTSIMAQGDPSVPASVKAHIIPGLPQSSQYRSPAGGPPQQ